MKIIVTLLALAVAVAYGSKYNGNVPPKYGASRYLDDDHYGAAYDRDDSNDATALALDDLDADDDNVYGSRYNSGGRYGSGYGGGYGGADRDNNRNRNRNRNANANANANRDENQNRNRNNVKSKNAVEDSINVSNY